MFYLGQKSEENLQGVAPELGQVVRRAITQSSVDFSVFEGVRSRARQEQLFRNGASRTLDSYHLTGHAVDLVPFVGGRLQWQQPLCNQIAIAVREAAIHFDVPVIWGAVWDRDLSELQPTELELAIENYSARYKAARGPRAVPLIDGPHFQVPRP